MPGGRVAYPNGIDPEPRRRKNVRLLNYDAEAGRRQFERLNRAVEESRLRVPIAAVFPLEQAVCGYSKATRDGSTAVKR